MKYAVRLRTDRRIAAAGTIILTSIVLTSIVASPAAAQNTYTWENATEFSFVSAAGNSSSNTLGLKSTLDGSNEESSFKFELGGIRASSTITVRTAVGTPEDFDVIRDDRTEESAANYFARTRYTRDVGDAFAFVGAGWERNTFSGIANRYSLVGGLGRTWIESDASRFRTDLGATYTIQRDIEEDPDDGDGFGGLRATIEARRGLGPTTDFETTMIVDENLSEADDLRLDWVASIAVALTQGLAFKTSYQMLFDNDPAAIGVPLLDSTGTQVGQVRVPSEKLDAFLTLSLVVKL